MIYIQTEDSKKLLQIFSEITLSHFSLPFPFVGGVLLCHWINTYLSNCCRTIWTEITHRPRICFDWQSQGTWLILDCRTENWAHVVRSQDSGRNESLCSVTLFFQSSRDSYSWITLPTSRVSLHTPISQMQLTLLKHAQRCFLHDSKSHHVESQN